MTRERKNQGNLAQRNSLDDSASTALMALPFLGFVTISVLLWSAWAVTGRSLAYAGFAMTPLVAAAIAWRVSAHGGEPPHRRAAPALVVASAVGILVWISWWFGIR